jgi:hypothetical protein
MEAQERVATLERVLRDHTKRSVRAYEAIEQLRAELAGLRADAGPVAAEPSVGGVDPERLSAALSRLREQTPPAARSVEEASPPQPAAPPVPERRRAPWLARAFREIGRRTRSLWHRR